MKIWEELHDGMIHDIEFEKLQLSEFDEMIKKNIHNDAIKDILISMRSMVAIKLKLLRALYKRRYGKYPKERKNVIQGE